jgi:hypothetical protein
MMRLAVSASLLALLLLALVLFLLTRGCRSPEEDPEAASDQKLLAFVTMNEAALTSYCADINGGRVGIIPGTVTYPSPPCARSTGLFEYVTKDSRGNVYFISCESTTFADYGVAHLANVDSKLEGDQCFPEIRRRKPLKAGWCVFLAR